MSRHLIVGLGNPGREYHATRHNIGFMILDRLASRHGIGLTSKKFKGVYGTGFIRTDAVALLLPQTFMNRSGHSVQPAAAFYDVEPERMIVVHDELDIDPGRVRIKVGGGHGGHNGLRDIIAKTGWRDFLRIRAGIGRPARGDVTGHVLSAFAKAEQEMRDEMIEVACDALEMILSDGVEATQNRFHAM